MPLRTAVFDRATLLFLAILIGLTWLRVVGLMATPLNLHFDEAQYWAWSRTLEWGYFSKPPLIAWAIAATTNLFGNEEWAVRLASPIAQSVASLILFAFGRSMYGAWAGFWTGLAWLTLPATWLSSGIISTDALLLPLWSLALLALWRMTQTRAWTWAIVLGLAVGVGALAKYAMLYFVLCTFFAARWSKPVRLALGGGRAWVAGLITLALLAPNLYWNIEHAFATVTHTAANARLTANFFNPGELLEFLLSQAGVIGPLFFVGLIWLLWRTAQRASGMSDEDSFLIAFIAPPLVIISVLALLSRANANWAVAAFPAAIVWIVGSVFVGVRGRRFLAAAIAVNVAIGGVFVAAAINPQFADQIQLSNAFKRARAWDETAREIATRAIAQPGEPPFTAVLVDHRALYYELAYYWRDARRAGAPLPPVRMWVLNANPGNAAEQSDPMRAEESGHVLVVHMTPRFAPFIAGDFTVFRTVEHLTIPLGGGVNRDLELSVAEGFAPVARDAAFEARVRGEASDD
jgi:4-amino-4-deoxy-L-arabinose transferase-like glycosyltransferase